MERLENFLKELAELTKKYNIAIGGCGCCGSPYIDDFQEEFLADNLCFDKKKQIYTLDRIIKNDEVME